jgi:iron complex outermembrane recepter protein
MKSALSILTIALFASSSPSVIAAPASEAPAASTAETADTSKAQDSIETIEVKGELIPTPESQTANSLEVLSSEALQAGGVAHFEDVLQELGNVNFSSGASRARFIQIRGIGERSQFVDPVNASVGFSIDGIDYSDIGASANLFDINQVEVFKGPQGTNAGANALAGFVNMISTQPGAAAPNRVRLEAGTYGTFNMGLAVGTEFNDASSGRIAISKNVSDGYIHNDTFIDGKPVERTDTNNIDEFSVRSLVNVEVNKDLSAQFILHFFEFHNGYDAFSLNQSRVTYSDQPGSDDQETKTFGVKANYTGLDFANITVNMSHRNHESVYSYDEDWTYVGYHPYEYSSTDAYIRDRAATQVDIRVADKNDMWVVGLYGQDRTVNLKREYTWLSGDFHSDNDQNNTAVYGEYRFALDKDVTINAGLRIENSEFSYTDNSGAFDKEKSESDTMVGGHFTASKFYSDEFMVYTRLSRGFKTGGINGQALGELNNPDLERFYPLLKANSSFKPEILNNVELGLRYNNVKRGIKANAVLFHSRREDMQVKQWFTNDREVQEEGATPIFVGYLSNAPTGANYGVETSLDYKLKDNIALNFGFSILETEVNNMYRIETDPVTFEDRRVKIDGRTQAHAPRYQYQAGIDWQVTDNIDWNFSVSGKDSFYYSYSHDQKSQAFTVMNTSFVYHGDNFDVTYWARNLASEYYGVRGFYFGNDPAKGYEATLYEQYGQPFVHGVSIEYLF